MRGWAVLVLVACGCAATVGPVPGVVAQREASPPACPLDHAPLEVPSVLLGEQTGVRLDLRPLGQGALLPPLVRCGRCGLVLDPERGEPPEDLEALRRAVASPAYHAASASPSDRLRRAVLLEEAGAPVQRRARAWLEAAWELEGVDEPGRTRSLERALAAYRQVAASVPRGLAKPLIAREPTESDLGRTADLLQVELLRQLSRFDQASSALEALAARPEFNRTVYAKLVPLERELVAARDAAPRPMPALGPIDWNDDDPDVLEARTLPGWATFEAEFTLDRASKGLINFQPEALKVNVSARGRRGIDSAWWWNPVDEQHHPRLTWGDFLRVFRSAEAVVARHPWLATWRQAYPERGLRLHAVGTRPWTVDLERRALKPWRDAGLAGAPAVELLLEFKSRVCGTVYLDEAGTGAVVLRHLGCPGEDWPLNPPLHAYLLVRPDGRWEQRTPPEAPARPTREVPR